jgi:uncharacterized protein (DUF58 family)
MTRAKRRLHRKVSLSGRLVIAFAALSLLFGINTRETMIYQLAALSWLLLLFAFPLSFFFATQMRVHRTLPETCTAGDKLTYLLHLENIGEKTISGLFFIENPDGRYPTYEEFNSTPEEGESDRNFFDRRFGYYRWLWLLERIAGARFEPFGLPLLQPKENIQFEVSLLPLRRGYIQLSGYALYRLEPLGLFKKEIFFRDSAKLLVLPRMYPVIQAEMAGSRKYHQGGVTTATRCGDTGEFVSLREYRPGDSVKHIDWKATARVDTAIVRQYQDEYFSRYGIVLDTFTGQEGTQVFEDAVSVAASIIVQQDSANNLIDLLFAGESCISSLSMGRGQTPQHQMLEVLACITGCKTREFKDLAEIVIGHTPLLSGLILILLVVDEQRKKLITHLKSSNIPHKVVLISADEGHSRESLARLSLTDVTLFGVEATTKIVDLR